MDWNTLITTISKNLSNSKVFFCVSTLEYLQKGGRIGLVSAILGSTLSLKPIISPALGVHTGPGTIGIVVQKL